MGLRQMPETSRGPRGFGLADARTAQVQIKYATQQLDDPSGACPRPARRMNRRLRRLRRRRATLPYYGTGADASHPNEGLSQCHGGATEDVVTPHASFLALDVAPQQASPT